MDAGSLTLKRQAVTGLCGLPLGIDADSLLVGEFFASGFASPAGLVGGGVGEEGVSGGFPAGSGVAEAADDEGGFFLGVVGGTDRAVFGSVYLTTAVEDAGVRGGFRR